MIKLENTEVVGWEHAIRDIPSRSYRRTKNGRYEAYCSDHSHSIFLGTYDTPEEAEEASYIYRANRLVSRVEEYRLNIYDGVVFMKNYIAFPNGMIFNLHGERIIGHVDRYGYISGIINRKNVRFHRIIASIFCEHEIGKDYVNHIDGNKLNNSADNLEWCTKSENTLHSFRNGLQNNIGGIPVYSEEEKEYIRDHRYDDSKEVADHIGRNPETVRKYMYKYRRECNND